MKITIDIPVKTFNNLTDLIGERYVFPTNKKVLMEIRKYLAVELARLGVDQYEGFNQVEFYDWIQERIAKRFKLKLHPDFD